jgi:F-type H+-transporting ATPase subunit a
MYFSSFLGASAKLQAPMEQFEILVLSDIFICPIANFNKFILTNVVILFLLINLFIYLTFYFLQNFGTSLIPTRLFSFVESIYYFVNSIITESINIYYYYKNLRGFLFLLFFVIVLCDLFGIVPYTFTLTSHLIFTFTLSTLILYFVNSVLVERYGFISLRFFLPSGAPLGIVPFLILIELVSYSARVFSLAIRLFANMMSGHILLKIFGEFSFALGLLGMPLNLLIAGFYYLEGLIAVLQAYVFLILTCIYFKEAIYLH